jgi:3-hydroxybutyryl-CoA dehydrogenase
MANSGASPAMTPDPIRTVAVIGAGTMGWQIGLQCAARGVVAQLTDISPAAVERALRQAGEKLDEWVDAGKLRVEERAEALKRLRPASDLLGAVEGVDLVIEAIVEEVPAKRVLFAELDRLCPRRVILATNSSSIRSRLLADATTRPDKVLNLHFLRRPWDRPVLEIMSCGQTSEETLATGAAFARQLGLVPIHVRKEATGYVYNRLWRALKKEALYMAREGIAPIEDIDRAFMLGMGAPAGPFMLMDQVGLDVTLDIERQWYAESGDERDRPPAFLEEWVREGRLGVKSGHGFYRYPDPPMGNAERGTRNSE